MPRGVQKALLLLSLCALNAGAQSQTVYRCGSHYSQVPCEGAVEINAEDARSAAQKAASEKAIARDGRIADTLEKTRLQAEKQHTAQDLELLQAQAKASKVAQKPSAKPRKTEKKTQAEPFVAKASASGSK
jgi:hypothetical protein